MKVLSLLMLMFIVNVVYSLRRLEGGRRPGGAAGVVALRMVKDLQLQVTQLTGTIANYDVRIQNLTSEISQLQLRFDQKLNGMVARYDVRIRNLTSEISQLRATNSQLPHEQNLNGTVANNDVRIQNLTTEIAQLQPPRDQKLNRTVAKNDVRIQNLTTEIAQLQPPRDQICKGGMVYANYCYYVLDGDYNFHDAQTACVESGGRLAAVTSTAVYDALEGFLRSIVVAAGTTILRFRMAMTFDPTRSAGREIASLDGTTVTWNKWFPGYPATTSLSAGYASFTTVIWRVEKTATFDQGFLNYPPSHSSNYRAVCRKAM